MGFVSLKEMNASKRFDIKALIYGNAGTGKTYLAGTYSHGPVMLYGFDPGGWKTLFSSPNIDKIQVADFAEEDVTKPVSFEKFWAQLMSDANTKIFDKLAAENGIVIVDSLSTLSIAAMAYALKQDQKAYNYQPEIQHYGKQSAYLRQLMQSLTSLPCAVILTAHIDYMLDKQGAVIKAYPAVTGKMKMSISQFFDEVWLAERSAGRYQLDFRGSSVFSAKSRIMRPTKPTASKVYDFTLDKLYDHYVEGKELEMGS